MKKVMFWLLSEKNMLVRKNNHIIVQFKAFLTIKSCFLQVSVSTFGITYIENISIEVVSSRAI